MNLSPIRNFLDDFRVYIAIMGSHCSKEDGKLTGVFLSSSSIPRHLLLHVVLDCLSFPSLFPRHLFLAAMPVGCFSFDLRSVMVTSNELPRWWWMLSAAAGLERAEAVLQEVVEVDSALSTLYPSVVISGRSFHLANSLVRFFNPRRQ